MPCRWVIIDLESEVLSMAKTLEQLAKEIYNEFLNDGEPISESEATEMAEMELGAKAIKNYTQAKVEKTKATRKPKINDNKISIVSSLASFLPSLEPCGNAVSGVHIANPQGEITFALDGKNYSIKVIEHRK